MPTSPERGAATAPVTVGEGALHSFVARLFEAAGMSAVDARLVASGLVWAELRGHGGHGVSRVPLYFEFLAKGGLDPKARPETIRRKPSILLVEARRAAGAVAMDVATAAVIDRVRDTGLCFALVRDTSHTGAIGLYAERLAAAGCAAIIGAAGPPLMAYHGAAAASLSTSPLAIAVPGPEGAPPVVVDMATSVVAMGRIMQARRAGMPIPADWALAADGTPTTDAAAAAILLPLGGAKGSGISLLLEMMCGVMANNPILATALDAQATGPGKWNGLQNAFIFALDVEAFRPIADFRRDAAALAAAIKALPRRADVDALYLPGERGATMAAQRSGAGIPLLPAVWQSLLDVAAKHNVTPPKP